MAKKMKTFRRKSIATLLKVAEKIAAQVTEGWTVTVEAGTASMDNDGRALAVWNPNTAHEDRYDQTHATVRFEKQVDDVRAVVALDVTSVSSEWNAKRSYDGCTVEGHVFVNGGCFTRRGIDCSSCGLTEHADRYDHEYATVADLLAGEWTRCESYVNRSKTLVAVPGLPFSRQPEWFVKAAADLRAGKAVTLTPHGFGTGYTLSTRRRFAYDKRYDVLEAKLAVSPIYVSTFDHD
jgi:hypothetical protein